MEITSEDRPSAQLELPCTSVSGLVAALMNAFLRFETNVSLHHQVSVTSAV
jgi:hypothetical protein